LGTPDYSGASAQPGISTDAGLRLFSFPPYPITVEITVFKDLEKIVDKTIFA
jgi:hypothetical protein